MIYNIDDPEADLELIIYMEKKAIEFMKINYPNNDKGYRVGFHRPPINS